MIGSEWINKYVGYRARIVGEPLVGVFELDYFNDTIGVQRWSARDLHRHWVRADMVLEEE
tara:strand:+ start:14873 stop:15052 length:180 start_codon:yes stop_codon:yes gene_type:complete